MRTERQKPTGLIEGPISIRNNRWMSSPNSDCRFIFNEAQGRVTIEEEEEEKKQFVALVLAALVVPGATNTDLSQSSTRQRSQMFHGLVVLSIAG